VSTIEADSDAFRTIEGDKAFRGLTPLTLGFVRIATSKPITDALICRGKKRRADHSLVCQRRRNEMKRIAITAFALVLPSAAAMGQYPVVDQVAAALVQKYNSATCAQLAAERQAAAGAPESPMKQRAGALLQQDAGARAAFVNKVAPTVVNKMIVCGFIP